MIQLSILIPTIPERKKIFSILWQEIARQVADGEYWHEVEVLFDPTERGVISTGLKRNKLLKAARGEYVWFIDDDDMIEPSAINAVMEGTKSGADCMAINGTMIYDGERTVPWDIAINNPYCADFSKGYERYLRYPNHITPMKRAIAVQVQFPDQSNFEDKSFADSLRINNLLKTEFKIEQPLYIYRYSTLNKTY